MPFAVPNIPEGELSSSEIERLSRKLNMLERVSELASIGGWRFDFDTREVLWSAQTRQIHEVDENFAPDEKNFYQFYVPETRDANEREIKRLNLSGLPYVMDIEILTARNRRIWTRVHGETQVVNGRAVSVWGTMQDISVQKNLELELQASEARFRSLTDLSSDWYWETDARFRFLVVQGRTTRCGAGVVPLPQGNCWWDVTTDNMKALDWHGFRQRLEARENFRSVELHTADESGAMVWVAISGTPYVGADGQFAGYRGVGTNITERKSAQLRVEHMAFFDALTGLPNRRMLLERLQHAVVTSSRRGVFGALVFIDLDRFKALNDSQGHAMGDNLLCQVAQRLLACVRQMDTVARFGGDEFVVMLEELDIDYDQAVAKAAAVGAKMLASINAPFLLDGGAATAPTPYSTSSSIGVTLYNGYEFDVDTLLQQADKAMYAAKSAGRNMLQFFKPPAV